MILDNIEKQRMEAFAKDESTFNTVKMIVAETINDYEERRLTEIKRKINTISNDMIGAELRGCEEGRRLVEAIFQELAQFKKGVPQLSRINPAR